MVSSLAPKLHRLEAANSGLTYSFWYLMVIGVDPVSQGQGYASKLLKPMLARLDEDSLPGYPETQKEKNATLYQHFGFNVIEEFTFGLQVTKRGRV